MSNTTSTRCPECRGSGRSSSTASGHYRCEDCEGTGRVEVCEDCDETLDHCVCAEEDAL